MRQEELDFVENTMATESNILKYYDALKSLHFLLQNTNRISMFDFSVKNKVTKNLSTVLQDGKIIKLVKRGRYSEWEWVSIEPTREMAIRVLKELAKFNPERKKTVKKVVTNTTTTNVKRPKQMILDSKTIKIGFIKIRINYNYKNK